MTKRLPRLIHADVEHVVERHCPAGHPAVLRCYPVRGRGEKLEPFPTLFWLVCPAQVEAISRLEHAGWIHRLEARIEEDLEARAEIEADHTTYIAERWSLVRPAHRAALLRLGRAAPLNERGIGGTADRRRIKCLHLHWAHHLARGSRIGAWIDAAGAPDLCAAACDAPAGE